MIRVGAFFRLIRDSDSNRTNFDGYRRLHFFAGEIFLRNTAALLQHVP